MIISIRSSKPKVRTKPGLSPLQYREAVAHRKDNAYKYTAWQASIFPGITLSKDHMGVSVTIFWLFWCILIEPGKIVVPECLKTK